MLIVITRNTGVCTNIIILAITMTIAEAIITSFLLNLSPIMPPGRVAISIILFGAGYGIYGNVSAFAQETVEDQWRGSAVGFMFLIFNLGSLIGGTLMAAAISFVGYRMAGLYVMIIPMILSFIFITLTPKIKIPSGGNSNKTKKVVEAE